MFEAIPQPVSRWRRWANFWRLRHSYTENVALEFYRTRKGVIVTKVVSWPSPRT